MPIALSQTLSTMDNAASTAHPAAALARRSASGGWRGTTLPSVRAPKTAPTPTADMRKPRPWASWPSTFVAISGTHMLKLNVREADHEEHREHRADLRRAQGIGNAFHDVLTDGRRALAARATVHADRGQRGEDEQVAAAADGEGRRYADAGDDEAGRGGTHDPRAVERRGAQRDRVAHVVPAHRLDHERLLHHVEKRIGQARAQRQDPDVPVRDYA